MALYFFTYDLRGRRDYPELYAELERFNAVRVLESNWCLKRINTSAEGLRNHFSQFMDNDDGLLVDESTSWATRHTDGAPKDLK